MNKFTKFCDASSLKFDAIIVLANLMESDGSLNEESKSRLDTAISVYNSNSIPFFVTCGWPYRTDSQIAIADSMRKYAIEHGVPADRVVADLNSRDTVGDAFFTKINLAMKNDWKKIAVVTSNYHVDRTREIFSFIYGVNFDIVVYGDSAIYPEKNIESEKKSMAAFRKTFLNVASGNNALIMKAIVENHPFYNGEIYPKISI